MKQKQLILASLAVAALIAAVGLWLARSGAGAERSTGVESNTAYNPTLERQANLGDTNNSRPRLAPPDQTRRFREFTPEQRVEFARKGHGPGG